MATPSSVWTPVGARNARLFELTDTIIEPGAASATAYEGHHVSGLKELTLTDPEPQQIFHMGDDSVFAVDQLPATEAIVGQVMSGKVNAAVEDIITGNNVVTLGEFKYTGIGTNNRGSEVQAALAFYRQALDTDPDSATLGARRWESFIFPLALAIPIESGMGGTEFSRTWTFRPQFVKKHLWGLAFSNATEGFTRAQGIKTIHEYKPKVAAWKGNGVLASFNLPVAFPAASVAKVRLFVYDDSTGTWSDDTSGATITTTTVDPSALAAADDIIIAVYEHNEGND